MWKGRVGGRRRGREPKKKRGKGWRGLWASLEESRERGRVRVGREGGSNLGGAEVCFERGGMRLREDRRVRAFMFSFLGLSLSIRNEKGEAQIQVVVPSGERPTSLTKAERKGKKET